MQTRRSLSCSTSRSLHPRCARPSAFTPRTPCHYYWRSIALQVRVVLNLVWWRSLDIADHGLFRGEIGGCRVERQLAPFFLSRVITVFIWSCQILWRMLRLRDVDSELVLLTGQVEFVYDRGLSSRSTSSVEKIPRAGWSGPRLRLLTELRVVPTAAKKDQRPSKAETARTR